MRTRITMVAALVVLAWAGPAGAQDGELEFNTGLSHLRDGRIQLAIAAFEEALDKDGENPYFLKGLGLAYVQADKLKDAIKAFRKALELNPYYVDVYNDLGTALILKGDRAEGKQQFLTAFNHPQNPTPELSARNLGQALLEEQRPDQALNWYQTSLQRNPRYSDAYVGISDCLRALQRHDEAIAQLEQGHERLPDDPGVALALGEAYYSQGRFNDARRLLEGVASSDPAGSFGRRALERLKAFPSQ
jgi:tetratricopeptide (TPR) repeat protein